MAKSQINPSHTDASSIDKREGDLAHTKVDPYQDPAYHAPVQSPAHALDTTKPAEEENEAQDKQTPAEHTDPAGPTTTNKAQHEENSSDIVNRKEDMARADFLLPKLTHREPDAWDKSGFIFLY